MREVTSMAVPKALERIFDTVWELPIFYKEGMRVPARIYGTLFHPGLIVKPNKSFVDVLDTHIGFWHLPSVSIGVY